MTQALPATLAASPRFAAVVVAAGKGLRTGGAIPKQFALWRGQPLLRHSVARLIEQGADPVVVVIPAGYENEARDALGNCQATLCIGGTTRQDSVRAALELLASRKNPIERVLIHDAARPDLPPAVIAALVEALEHHAGAIPTLPVVDSVVRGAEGLWASAESRDGLHRVQTPQAFRFPAILAAHRGWTSNAEAGDDAIVARAAGHDVALIEGDERLRKITFANDFGDNSHVNTRLVRTGLGFDVHRLVAGEELWLCGVRIDHPLGLSGHSDADVAIHAAVDALLGAIAAGDIGDHFPPSDMRWKDASSDRFLAHAAQLVAEAGYAIAHLDLTIICEAPKIGPHKAAMRSRLAQILDAPLDRVSVKATTTERLGTTGRGEGIAAQAIATLVPLDA